MDEHSKDNLRRIADSPSYRLTELDADFLARPELRPVRMQLELLKPELAFTLNCVFSFTLCPAEDALPASRSGACHFPWRIWHLK
jgi:hypothetical protein